MGVLVLEARIGNINTQVSFIKNFVTRDFYIYSFATVNDLCFKKLQFIRIIMVKNLYFNSLLKKPV